MKFFKNNKGFTLVELVVVIAILGILAGIAIPRFMDATASARGAKIVADLRTIDSAIVMYQAKTGNPPTAIDQITTDVAASSKYKLLADWPVPPLGAATVADNSGKVVEIQASSVTTQQSYNIGTGDETKGRAVLGDAANGKTVDQLLKPTTTNQG